MTTLPALGTGRIGLDGYGETLAFIVVRADALSPTLVRVQFNAQLSLTDPEVTNPANYSINHGISVHSVVAETNYSVHLTTDYLSASLYTVSVFNLHSSWHQPIDTDWNSADFYGYAITTSFRAIAVSETKVRLAFTAVMSADVEFLNPANYRVVAVDGTIIAVSEVIPEGVPGAPVAVALTLVSPLQKQILYDAQLLTMSIHTASGGNVYPLNASFTWVPKKLLVSAAWRDFGGNGPLGNTGFYFSPSLFTSAPESAIQVSWASTCALAYDTYEWRDVPEHGAFYTYGSGHSSQLCGPDALLGRFDFMGLTHEAIDQHLADSVAYVTSSRCIGELKEPWDPLRVSELNSLNRPLFDNITTTPFITAANLTPIPPGGITTVVLEP